MSGHSPEHDAAAVDQYVARALGLNDPVLDAGREHAHRSGLPQIEVSAAQGKLLKLLAELVGARRVLEIGTLGGFSTSWLARGVGESGQVVTCEFEPLHAKVARENLERAALADRVQIHIGPAADTLATLIDENTEPFDLIFIDADKRSNVTYLGLGLELARPGTLLIVDNVVRNGAILDDPDEHGEASADIRGVQDALAWLGKDPRVDATALQTVGAKGWDGLAVARVL
ncbi:O-methyltransferase [Glutamicibacter sp. MNS18]|uniref:O-methyltransferase n=1 Tax=Glutamicibacter sp. MNS18 TaxID=2989817 RepID=UPI0022354A30|nr:O-methyltransferase [Glutamicibacter sp. MNS18]MCW4466041.1 O-methyltransferase [Glutamicibacter sp. MNS18]